MIIYFYLFIPLLFLPADSSSIRDRSNKNELVPFLNSRLDAVKRDPNSLKVVSSDPFIIQVQMPGEKLKEAKGSKDSSKKRKRPAKKRTSKIKPLRKKHRTRRDLHTSKTKTKKEKLNQSEIQSAGQPVEQKLNNATKNSGSQIEILKALSSYSKKRENKRNKLEGIKNFKDDERSKSEKVKQNITASALSRNSLKHHLPPSDLPPPVKLLYPSTPKSDRHPHKYVYKDLVADRERLEQKIKYIKNMLSVNDSAAEDAARIRRRSESDRTANKIAKMFLTLSAVNGLHDRRKSKCNEDDDDDEDRTQDIWEKERKNSPSRKSFSSNEERYKVKKWIEFMKNERSSGKICPCTSNDYNEDSDIFPLEQKVPKGYFTMERDRSSEESSESYRDSFYHSRHRLNKNNNNFPRQTYIAQEDQENKLKASAKNGKKKLELPLDDLETYRSKAKQILQNAEEILDRIKEEEEKRFSPPNVLMNHLKELTSRIQTDPRNNENDLIRHIQKMLGWTPLDKAQGSANENTFVENVKSFILDPYEKAKSLTDESTKKLSSYLLRNLGKLPEFSGREKEQGEADEKTSKENLKVFFGQVAPKEDDKLLSDSLGKEAPETGSQFKLKDSSNREDPLSINLDDNDEFKGKESHLNGKQDDSLKQEDTVKEQEKEYIEYKEPFYNPDENTTGVKSVDDEAVKEKEMNEAITTTRPEKEPEKTLEDKLTSQMKEGIDENSQEKRDTLDNSESTREDQTEKGIVKAESTPPDLEKTQKDFSSIVKKEGPAEKSKTGHDVTSSENVQRSGEFRKETEKPDDVNSLLSKESQDRKGLNAEGKKGSESNEKAETNGNVAGENLQEKRKLENEDINEKNKNHEKVPENVGISQKSRGSASEEDKNGPEISTPEDKERETVFPSYGNQNEELKTLADIDRNLKEIAKAVSDIDLDKISSKEGTVWDNQDQLGIKNNEEDQTKADTDLKGDSVVENFEKISDSPENTGGSFALEKAFEDPTAENPTESPKEKERQNFFNPETTQLEDTAKKLQYADLIQETDEKSGENRLQGEHQTITEDEGKTGKHEGEPVKLEHAVDGNDRTGEKETGKKEINDENLKEMKKMDDKNAQDGETGKREEEKLKEEPTDDEKDQTGEGKTGKHEENLKLERPDDENGQISEGETVKEEIRDENLKEMRTTNDENDEGDEAGNLSENDQAGEGKAQINDENLKEMRTIDGENDEDDERGKQEEENLKSERADDENDKTEKEELNNENLKEMRTMDDEDDENDGMRKHDGENLKQERTDDENDGETGKEEINDETLKTALDSKGDSEPLESINVKSVSSSVPDNQENQNDMNADVTDSLLDFIQKYSNEGFDEKTVNNEHQTKSDEVSAIKATNSESDKTSAEDVAGETPSNEALESRSEESSHGETALRSEKPTEEMKNQSVSTADDDEQVETSLKEVDSTDKGTQNSNEDDLSSQNGEKSLEGKDADGTASSVALSEEALSTKLNEQTQNSFEKDNDKSSLKAVLNEDKNLSTKDADEIPLKETNQIMSETDDGETQNSYPNSDKILQKEDQNQEYLKETGEKDVLESTKPSEDQETNQEYKSLEKTDVKEDTLGEALDEPNQEKQKEINESFVKAASFDEHQEDKNEDNSEKILMENPRHEGLDETESPEILVTPASSQERAIKDENEGILEQINPDENVQEGGNVENSDDDSKGTLKATLKNSNGEDSEDVNDETLQKVDTSRANVGDPRVEQDDHNFGGGNGYEFLPGTFDSGSEESLEEQTHETLKSKEGSEKDQENVNNGEADLGAALRNQDQEETNDNENTLTEANFKETEAERNNLNADDAEDTLGAVLDNQERSKGMTDGENSEKFDPEEVKHDEISSTAATSGVDTQVKKADQHEVDEVSLKAGPNREDRNNLEETEALRTGNHEKVPDNNSSDETLSRNLKRLEDELENKIDNEDALKLAKVADETNNLESEGGAIEEGSEETLRAKEINNDLNNQIDQIQEKTSGESARLDETNVKAPEESSEEDSYDTLRAENVPGETSSEEGNDEPPLGAENQFKETNSQELQEQVPPYLLSRLVQPPSSASKSLKSNKLTVPQSIGKIMRDLESKEKDDVTSLRNLNPEQIDHMLGKIDEAEQQNLLEGDEKDCEKECACAEEINTRSRNIGRYEIVKDFLHWMKDLQLNRVLSDD